MRRAVSLCRRLACASAKNMALSNIDIHRFLDRYAPHTFNGVFSYDQFDPAECPHYPIAMVVNARPGRVEMGHWCAVFVDRDRNGNFFDSYGLRPWGKFSKFFERHSNKTFFSKDILQLDETSCGQHCIFFVCQMSKGRLLEDVLMLYRTHAYKTGDEMVNLYVARRMPYVKRTSATL